MAVAKVLPLALALLFTHLPAPPSLSDYLSLHILVPTAGNSAPFC